HERGAFTGADKASEGLIRQAHEGTLFLDEVGELPRSLQKAFLRVLQEHRFRPVGAKLEVVSNFRLVAATNRDLDEMVRRGQFRNDLLFRLRSITIELPPLRERDGDMTELAMYHTARVCKRYKMGIKGFSPEFFEALGVYEWPGNVRELLNALESALATAGNEPTLFPAHLPTQIRIKLARASVNKKIAHKGIPREDTGGPLPKLQAIRQAAIAKAEQQYLQDLMLHTGANIGKVCEVSGLRRSRFYELLRKYNIPKF
ncbi:MAG TPA: sigma-54-dependent Fis family transcriptional regulator, partial [Desulfobulbaceae bacterium]|nr:sigma-54-dependent Fis family transcriptional regulator [Desulfobulbaceae bacterium]